VFAAFEEAGDVFDPDVAEKCRKFIYSAGNTVAPQMLFQSFRGRDPDISHFLKNRGLV
jgi:peptidyl-dipeptidase Dcp